eukprot:CAMPEP_0169265878 /NCGR_PEP_ID=MMETSP1016-20121227/46045_1 /TAXON_ID=342587 /ORGANISM="Karlodinium micrum, Strain CCMP2283" /LENGTH=142 /DNA_ID=CAMNT_0009349639 /DNA_START=421 /DNA_END=849 /DNA_ORIENTATION=+
MAPPNVSSFLWNASFHKKAATAKNKRSSASVGLALQRGARCFASAKQYPMAESWSEHPMPADRCGEIWLMHLDLHCRALPAFTNLTKPCIVATVAWSFGDTCDITGWEWLRRTWGCALRIGGGDTILRTDAGGDATLGDAVN